MKQLFTLIAFFAISQVRAMEFDPSLEQKCYTEVKKLGCTDNKGGEENASCVEGKKAKLSKDCRTFNETKKTIKK